MMVIVTCGFESGNTPGPDFEIVEWTIRQCDLTARCIHEVVEAADGGLDTAAMVL